MHPFLFYLFAALTLLCGVLVVANPFTRNPVTSAMFLVLTIVSMAGLYLPARSSFWDLVHVYDEVNTDIATRIYREIGPELAHTE